MQPTLLVSPTNPNAETVTGDVQRAERTLGLRVQVMHANAEQDFD
jgi:hypothetical protein